MFPLLFSRKSRSKSATNRKTMRGRRSRRLVLESLEDRRMLTITDLAAISGTLFYNLAGGVQQPIPGQDVRLYEDDGDGVFNIADTLKATETTDANGKYRFDGLTAATYFVVQPPEPSGNIHPAPLPIVSKVVVTPDDAAGAKGIVLDEFGTSQNLTAQLPPDGTTPVSSSVEASDAVGGHRQIIVEAFEGDVGVQVRVNANNNNRFSYAEDSGVRGRAEIFWDGTPGDHLLVNPTGLGGIDLTDDGVQDAFEVFTFVSDWPSVETITVYSDAGRASRLINDVPGATVNLARMIPFSDFVPVPGFLPADFTNVGAVTFEIKKNPDPFWTLFGLDYILERINTVGPKVFEVNLPYQVTSEIGLTKLTNDTDNDLPTGPYVPVGSLVTWTYEVANPGNEALANVQVTDDQPGVNPVAVLDNGFNIGDTNQNNLLEPGETWQFTASGTAVAGQYTNLGKATGTGTVSGTPLEADNPDHYFGAEADIQLVKTGSFQDENGDGLADVGETIAFSFTVTNTGNVTLTDVTLTDTVGGVTISGGPIASLAPGQTDNTTFTGSYSITQADIDAGTFENVATVTGTPPIGPPVEDEDDHEEPLPQNPEIQLVKTGQFQDENGDGYADPGETITYSFAVTNTGNVTLTNVTLTDTVGGVTISGGPIASLAPGESDDTTFTGSYTITQADIDLGLFVNVATVTGDPPDGPPVDDEDDHEEPLPQEPAIELIKTGEFQDENNDGYADAGETIAFSFTVTNTGNVTLTDVTLTDTVGGVTISGGPIASLAPGESDDTTFTGSYTVTQADIDLGLFVNVATVTGDPPDGPPVDDEDDHEEPLPQNPAIELLKTGSFQDENGDGLADVGETIAFSFTVTNTGNVTLTDVTLTDTVGGVTISGGPIASLAPGESDDTTFTGSYTVTQADIDLGLFVNVATVTGDPPDGPPVDDEDDHEEPLPQNPAIELLKTGSFQDENGDGLADVGETIAFSFTVTNTGNVTLTDVTLTDTVGGVTISGGPIASLAPGESDDTTFTGSYTVTQADIDLGLFVNVATVTGDPPDGPPVDDEDDHEEPLPQEPAIELLKTGEFQDENNDGYADAGETIAFSFTVTNTGNVTLTDVTLTDTVGGVTISGGPIASLAPGESDDTTFTGSYTVTQADIDLGLFVNVATVTGDPPDGPPVDDEDDHEEPLPQNPAIELLKTGSFQDENGDGLADVGETISYSFTVTNTGNVTLTDVTLTDTVGGVTISGGPIASLAPGESDDTTFTGSYTITQADIDLGLFVNVATVTGDPPDGPPVDDEDDHEEPLPQNPAIELLKTGSFQDENGDGLADVGETIAFSFTVTNTGNVTLTDVTLTDTVGGVTISGGPIASLAPGESDDTTFTGSYTVTQADIDLGLFVNVATVTGDPPDGPPVDDEDDHEEPLPQEPAIELLKTGSFQDENNDGYADAGETITFNFTVTNTGNVTLTDVTLSDTIDGVAISGGPIAVLPVGGVDSTTFTGSYVITQADIDSGSFTNLATVTGTPPTGPPVDDDDDHEEPLPQNPAIDLIKTGEFQDESGDGIPQPGETISYQFTVTNTGNVTLYNVTLVDSIGGVTISGGPIPVLPVGGVDSTTFTGSYAITPVDIEAQQFYNVATVTGVPPTGPPVSDEDDHTEPLRQRPPYIVIAPDKNPGTPQRVTVINGDTQQVEYQFLAYEANYTGGTRVSVADLTGDGNDLVITAPGRSRLPEIRIFTIEGNPVPGFPSFLAYPAKYNGGVHVTVADVNGDGKPDIITVPSYGAADVRVFFNRYDALNPTSPAFSATPDISFKAFSKAITGGSVIAAGDMGRLVGTTFVNNPDGNAEIVVGTGAGIKATVAVFELSGATPRQVRSFFPFTQINTNFKGGVSLEVAKVNADPIPDIIVGMGVNGTSRIEVWTWNTANATLSLAGAIPNAFLGSSYRAPVDVAALMDSNGFAETIVAVQGPGAGTQQVRRFDILSRSPLVFQQDSPLAPYPGPWFVATSRNLAATTAGPSGFRAVSPLDADVPPKFFVVDAQANNIFHYGEDGDHRNDRDFAPGQIQQRGITTTADGSRIWIVDAKKVVRVFDADGNLLGSWTAPKLKTPTGIATDGVNIWIVDQKAKQVYRFDNAAEVRSGSLNWSSSFKLHRSNSKAEGITTDGKSLWVVDNAKKQDRVWVYNTAGQRLGSWIIDPVNATPTGLTIDPTGASQSIWIVDGRQAAVYEYTNARSAVSGNRFAADVFTLAPGNAAPQGIADPDGNLTRNRSEETADAFLAAGSGLGTTTASDAGLVQWIAAPLDHRVSMPFGSAVADAGLTVADLLSSARLNPTASAPEAPRLATAEAGSFWQDLLEDLTSRGAGCQKSAEDGLFADLGWLEERLSDFPA
jgi:uncharacterized repeat protein (TIGR01451 family)